MDLAPVRELGTQVTQRFRSGIVEQRQGSRNLREGTRSTSFGNAKPTSKPEFPALSISGSAPNVLQQSRLAISPGNNQRRRPSAPQSRKRTGRRSSTIDLTGEDTPESLGGGQNEHDLSHLAENHVDLGIKRRRRSCQQGADADKKLAIGFHSSMSLDSASNSSSNLTSMSTPSLTPDHDSCNDDTDELVGPLQETDMNEYQSSSTATEKTVESLSDSDEAGEDTGASKRSPKFSPYHNPKLKVLQITHEVFKEMQKSLIYSKKDDYGCIYTLSMEDYPGYIKIGRTTRPIEKRQSEINACIPYKLKVINDDDRCQFAHHSRVESLIIAALGNARQSFECPCKKTRKQKLHDCEGFSGLTKHGEWFKIDEATAIETVRRWRSWMSLGPYLDGLLRWSEETRVCYYSRNPDRMKSMLASDEESWHWDEFMKISNARLWNMRVQNFLFRERHEGSPVKPTSSRWDSLWTHWQANLLFFVTFFVVSLALSLVSILLPSTVGNTLFPLINSLILGSGAIFYAA